MGNIWLHCTPLPKQSIRRIEAICRIFLWSGYEKVSRKSPIAWNSVCAPKNKGGLNIVNLQVWSKACLSRYPWNLSGKEDNLWIRWVHSYYLKGQGIINTPIRSYASWILKSMLTLRDEVSGLHVWDNMIL
ncbi:unnamed protein product [Vicia faba]|uniref:Uncharacterized protein n=1 Tax=Vicia faba TaxID=3906 RepID=A0AAV1ACI4_VICFA|nr:unnamed protein product [Vicia faba]